MKPYPILIQTFEHVEKNQVVNGKVTGSLIHHSSFPGYSKTGKAALLNSDRN
jgi:hypothetical protein